MIIIDFELLSANNGRSSSKGIITISNVRQYRRPGKPVFADYRVKAYPKGVKREAILAGTATPHRQATIIAHPKHLEPVWNLVLKALEKLGYD